MFCPGRVVLPLLASLLWFSAAAPVAQAQSGESSLGERLLSLFESGQVVSQTPHPSVARIIVPEGDGFAYGSGTLVDANDTMGLVVTNWHVVSGGRGQITVRFPDGFESPAQVLKTDRDWDLAALAIRRPNVAPVRLSTRVPQPGEVLTIAGYGSGNYRAMSGPCTQFVSPGDAFPFEMVELRARARQGDSGGPILNTRGELAGVLFGEGGGNTSGSHCGRVHLFLTGLRAPAPFSPATQQVALTSMPQRSSVAANSAASTISVTPQQPQPVVPIAPAPVTPATLAPRAEPALASDTSLANSSIRTPPISSTGWQSPMPTTYSSSFPPVASQPSRSPSPDDLIAWQEWQDILGHSQPERIKTILAAIGVLLLALHTHRWIQGGQG